MQAVARRVLAGDGDDAPSAVDAVDVAGAVESTSRSCRRRSSVMRALLQLVEHGSALFRAARPVFTHMAAAEQDATLADWQRSSLTVRRRGFQALRTLCLCRLLRATIARGRSWVLGADAAQAHG